MPRKVLQDESRDVQWQVDGRNIRVQPTVAAVIEEDRPVSQARHEHLTFSTLQLTLIRRIVAADFESVYRALGRLLGWHSPNGIPTPKCEVCCPGCGLHFLVEARPEVKAA